MNFKINNKQNLIGWLKAQGIEKKLFPSFMRSVKICLDDDPELNHIKANRERYFLGWEDIELDHHTLQLAKKNFKQRELYPYLAQA